MSMWLLLEFNYYKNNKTFDLIGDKSENLLSSQVRPVNPGAHAH